MQLSMIIIFFGLMLELVEFNESYKIKPYKHYNPHPWRRPRWHPLPKQKRYLRKRIPSQKYHYDPESAYYRYAPQYEDSDVDTSDHAKPYIIVIQFPQKNEKGKYHSYQRKHVTDPPENNDYTDDTDEMNGYQLNN